MSNILNSNSKGQGIYYNFRSFAFMFILLFFQISMYSQNSTENKDIPVVHHKSGLKAKHKHTMDSRIPEGSGLAAWNGKLWTFNDSGKPTLFALDTIDGKIVTEYDLGVTNRDWEEISQDNHYLYIGNFGNNAGKRKTLQIYRVSKEKLLQNKVALDSITFEWPIIKKSAHSKKVKNFDCEAMVVINDTIYLFTKEWRKHRRSQIFKLPASPSHHVAEYVTTLKTHTLITGASYSPKTKRVVLCGYNLFLSPRIVTLSFSGDKVFENVYKAKQIRTKQVLRQTEGLTSFNGKDYYVISEGTNLLFWKNKPKLYKVKVPVDKK